MSATLHYHIALAMFGAQWYLWLCPVATVVKEFVVAQRQDAVITLNLTWRSR